MTLPAPIYYGSGDIGGKDFWLFGALLVVVFIGTFLLVGVPWMVFLGHWTNPAYDARRWASAMNFAI